jgi:membrane-associated protein
MQTIELINQIENFYATYGYPLVFLFSLAEITPFGFAIPGGTVLIVGGFFAYEGKVNLFGIITSGWLGTWTTFLMAYFLGYKTGYWLVKKLKQQKNAKRAKRLLDNHGAVILTTSMLANLTRFWVAYMAGQQKHKFSKFLLYSGAASLTWSSLMTVAGYLAGSGRQNLERVIARLGVAAWVFVIFVFFIVYVLAKKEFKQYKGEDDNSRN